MYVVFVKLNELVAAPAAAHQLSISGMRRELVLVVPDRPKIKTELILNGTLTSRSLATVLGSSGLTSVQQITNMTNTKAHTRTHDTYTKPGTSLGK